MIEHYIQHHENEPPVRVDIDLSLADELPLIGRPLLLWVFVKLKNPDASGMCTDEECGRLWQMREAIKIALNEHAGARFSGSRICEGWFELFFYARSGKGLTAVVGKALEPFGDYAFDTGSSRDEKFEHYEEELYPDAMMLHQIQNRHIIEELRDAGDDLELEREVEHYLFFQLPAQADRAVGQLEAHGYLLKAAVEQDGAYCHGRIVVREQKVTEEAMMDSVSELLETVYSEHGIYEGWSTVLARV